MELDELINFDDFKKAYELLKRYIYTNKDKLAGYERIVEFENREGTLEDKLYLIFANFQNLLDLPVDKVKDQLSCDEYWKPLFEQVDAEIFLKRKSSDQTNERVFKNCQNPEITDSDKLMYFIDLPIELHLIAMIWCLKIGIYLNAEVDDLEENLFANKIKWKDRENQEVGSSLYEAFYRGYNKWVRSAITNIKNLLEEKKKALFVSIDLKDYFYSVSIDYTTLHRSSRLNILLEETTACFFHKLSHTYKVKKIVGYHPKTNHYPLPIGLCSSNILANWVFKDYDRAIKTKLHPCFYGRYVDDILLVICNPDIESSGANDVIDFFLSDLLVDHEENKGKEFKSIFADMSKFIIKDEKVSVAIFEPDYCTLSLQRLEEQIQENSSEFEFLPDEEILDSNFGKVVDIAQVTDDLQRLGDVRIHKTKLSFFLAKLSSILTLAPNKDPKIKEWIISLIQCFNGLNAIELYSQWEKLLSACLLYGDSDLLDLALKNIDRTLTEIKTDLKASKEANRVRRSYLKHFQRSVALAMCLKPKLTIDFEKYENLASKSVYGLASKLRRGLMFRWNYLQYPLVPLTKLVFNLEAVPISNINSFMDNLSQAPRDIEDPLGLIDLTDIVIPIFISLHDFVLFLQLKKVAYGNLDLTIHDDTELEQLFSLFHPDEQITNILEITNNNYIENPNGHISLPNNSINKDSFRIAIVNMDYDANLSLERLESPTVSLDDIEDFSFVLNQAKREETDIICFPEISVDRQLLTWLSLFSRKNQMVIIAGVKHWISNNFAYNFLLTILPFEYNGRRFSVPVFRLKNYYAPEEIHQIEGYGYQIPREPSLIKYDLFIWKGLYFTSFNCYELADIKSRMLFRSEVDLIVASEYNKDTNYFSSIVESSTRDLHCYFTQANNAKYGDSRVSKPAKTEQKDIVKIKGGINTTLLVSKIDVKALREFQGKEYHLQKEDKKFKPTPPRFNKEKVRGRVRRRIYLGYERKSFEIE